MDHKIPIREIFPAATSPGDFLSPDGAAFRTSLTFGFAIQDPNKKIIKCDEKLKKIFAGKDEVGFLEIAGLISPHFLK
ncbi:hypothetical protein LINPERHAP2_LOCUS39942 [Linum perenne]